MTLKQVALKQVAQQVMKYLDKVGVAADYDIDNDRLWIATDDRGLVFYNNSDLDYLMKEIKSYCPQKSPAYLQGFPFAKVYFLAACFDSTFRATPRTTNDSACF